MEEWIEMVKDLSAKERIITNTDWGKLGQGAGGPGHSFRGPGGRKRER